MRKICNIILELLIIIISILSFMFIGYIGICILIYGIATDESIKFLIIIFGLLIIFMAICIIMFPLAEILDELGGKK